LPAVTENDGRASPLRLDDGSNIILAMGVRLETIRNDGRAFVSRVAGGTATFDVHPGGPRRWSIRCGESTVEVIGTRFDVECSGAHGRVRVERGVVHVHAATTTAAVTPADRQDEVSLVAGESIEIGGSTPAEEAPVPSAPSVLRGPMPASESAQRAAPVDPVADQLALADRARLAGNATDAVKPLLRIVREHPSDPRAALASFMLGRVQLDMLGNAVGAADAFERAIALGLSRGLLEDAYVRLVEARTRAGDAAGARKAAADYDTRFPGGEQSAAIARWLGPH
jgi:transmembrane sensor